jgi:plasmid stabilization system protein ParE
VSFRVRWSVQARADLIRLHDFLLDRAETIEDLDLAARLIDELEAAIGNHLSASPWAYRKAGDGRRSTRRELIIPSGAIGYLALFEIVDPANVLVLAVRHQRESDYH